MPMLNIARAADLRASAAELDRDAEGMLADRACILNPWNRQAAADMRATARDMRRQAARLETLKRV